MGANTSKQRILIADDQSAVREALKLLLKTEGYATELVDSPARLIEAIAKEEFALGLIDLNYTRDTTSGQEGLDLLQKLQTLEGAPPIIVMTAWATIDLAVEAMRRGARDFIQKPWDNQRVLAIVRTQLELFTARRQNQRLQSENELLRRDSNNPSDDKFVAESPSMRSIVEIIRRVGPSDANVLITGENGTGKGVVARALHAASLRSDRPLISVNIGGLSENLFESELFGHVKGAFTDAKSDRAGRFELADGGTLFLDEIGNLPLAQQAKLLRTVETGEFEPVGSSKTRRTDTRLLSATNANLPGEVEAGAFRRDLFFRLNTVELRLPALSERREDIPVLAQQFLKRHVAKYRRQISGFDSAAERALVAHPWPGNVRELDHTVERAVLMTPHEFIRPVDLWGNSSESAGPTRLEEMSLEEVERFLIQKTLARFGGNARKAAEALGVSRATFYRRLQEYQL